MTVTTARSRAVAAEGRGIDHSQQRAIAARQANDVAKPRNALEAMSARLEVSPGALKETLLKTVFATCRNDSEFIALVIVANTYGLNPLLKEIYAFPAKGGGVVPMVSVDGWIKLMHAHPCYDSIEFEDIADEKGSIYAIEATIYRTDKTRPTKIIEYLDECRRNTDPWKQSPLRMLRHRSLIQCARVAFGFSGIVAEGEDVIESASISPTTLPTRQSLGAELNDQIPNFEQAHGQRQADERHDAETGEVLQRDSRGMSEVDEETARQLDAGNDGTLADDNPSAEEGPAQEQSGEQHAADEPEPTYLAGVREVRKKLSGAKSVRAVEGIDRDWCNGLRDSVEQGDEGLMRMVDRDIANRKRELAGKAEG